jgi:hypothetical protein
MKTKKNQVKQQIVATLVVVFMFGMVLGSMDVRDAEAIGSNSLLRQVVLAGSLSLEATNFLLFPSVTLNATAQNSTANLGQVNMRDPRGTGAGWTAIGSANNMVAANGAVISNVHLSWAPGTIYALDGSSNAGVAAGASYSGNFGDGTRTLANTSTNNGLGNYVINGTILNLLILPSTLAGTYENTLTLTIS